MVQEVIPTFDTSQHDTLKAEARKWRLPYWDWAAKKQRTDVDEKDYDVPLILKEPTVKVFTFTGEDDIPNPFFQFTTPYAMGKWGIVHIQYQKDPPKVRQTAICGPVLTEALAFSTSTSKNVMQPARSLPVPIPTQWRRIGPEACRISNLSLKTFGPLTGIKEGMENASLERPSIVYSVWSISLVTANSPRPDMSRGRIRETPSLGKAFTSKRIRFPSCLFSNLKFASNLHGWIGGDWGHMGHIPVAAFDPIFWMHHALVTQLSPGHFWLNHCIQQHRSHLCHLPGVVSLGEALVVG
jgi:tyrosinase